MALGLVLEHLDAVRLDAVLVFDAFGSHRNFPHFLGFDPLANLHGNLGHNPLGDGPSNRERHLADLLLVLHPEHLLRDSLRDHFILVPHNLDGHLLRDRPRDDLSDRNLLGDHVGDVLLLHLIGSWGLRGNPVQSAAMPHRLACGRFRIVGSRQPAQPRLSRSGAEDVAVDVATLVDVLGRQRGLLLVGGDLLLLHHGVGYRAAHHLLLLVDPLFPHRPLHHVALLPRLGFVNIGDAVVRFLAILGFPHGPTRHMPLFPLVGFDHGPSDLVTAFAQLLLPNRLVDGDGSFDERGLVFQSVDRDRTIIVDRFLHEPIVAAFARWLNRWLERWIGCQLRHRVLRGRGPRDRRRPWRRELRRRHHRARHDDAKQARADRPSGDEGTRRDSGAFSGNWGSRHRPPGRVSRGWRIHCKPRDSIVHHGRRH